MAVREISLRGPLPHDAADHATGFVGAVPQDLLLFVHGFNVDLDRARRQYRQMHGLLYRLAWRPRSNVVYLHWPGDHPTSRLSAVYFKRGAKLADQCVTPLIELLKDWRLQHGMPRSLTLVAHSLGCRIAVALAREVIRQNIGVELHLVLMAAAIPTRDDQVALKGVSGRMAMYSEADDILRFVFPLGQQMVDGDWLQLPEAVGLHGNPPPAWSRRWRMKDHGHSDYWESHPVAQHVCDAMHLTTAHPSAQRHMPAHSLQGFPALPVNRRVERLMRVREARSRALG